MEKKKSNRLTEIAVIVVVIICFGLIVTELITNVGDMLNILL